MRRKLAPKGFRDSLCQRVEDNAFHLLKVDRLLPWRAVASAEAAEDDAKTNRQRRKTLLAEITTFLFA